LEIEAGRGAAAGAWQGQSLQGWWGVALLVVWGCCGVGLLWCGVSACDGV
jgi:hypothetical protein